MDVRREEFVRDLLLTPFVQGKNARDGGAIFAVTLPIEPSKR